MPYFALKKVIMNRDIEKKLDNLNGLREDNVATYCDERIAFIENLQDIEYTGPVKVEAFLAVLCQQGRSSVSIDGKLFEIAPNDLLICHPNIILEQRIASMDMKFRCICLSRDYIRQLSLIGDGNPWDALVFLEKSPVLQLSAEEATGFCQYYDLIHAKLTGAPRRHQKQLIDALLLAFLYDFRDTLERFVILKPSTYTASEKMFREFLDLLSASSPKPRTVAYYADKLCITPKYLSSVCKEASGHTASELINRYVVKDVQYLLKQHHKSIKEICIELDFPNLSFFGRYVKKHLGMSPKRWREQNL